MPILFDNNGSYLAHECPKCGVIKFASIATPPPGWDPIVIEDSIDYICPNCQRVRREPKCPTN